MFWSIYDIELLTLNGLYAPQQLPVRLKLTYLRDFTAKDLIDRTREEWEALGVTQPETEQWLSVLRDIWPDIREGDSLELSADCSQVSRFYFNGKLAGTIEDTGFAPAFLGIWLSSDTSQPEMRERLLANNFRETKALPCR